MLAIIHESEVEHTYIGCACVTYVCMDNASWLVLFFNVTLPKFCITADEDPRIETSCTRLK